MKKSIRTEAPTWFPESAEDLKPQDLEMAILNAEEELDEIFFEEENFIFEDFAA